MYDGLKIDSQNTNLSSLNSEGHDVYYMFNTTESQLCVDGAMFYGLTYPQNVSVFLKFEETCYFDECFEFIPTIVSTYCKSFVECTPLVVLWLSEVQVECSFVYQMFGKKYVFLSGDDLSIFIIWVKVLRDQYRTDGIKCLEGIIVKFYSEGYLSLQHTDGQSAYSRHLSCCERTKMGELLVNNSVSQIYNKQFNNSSNQGICFGKFTSLKSQDCLRKVKAELKPKERFSSLYM